MSVEEVERGLSWLESRFHVIKYVKVGDLGVWNGWMKVWVRCKGPV